MPVSNLRSTTAMTPVLPRSAPPKPVLYTGPAIPTAYDPNWQKYTNLTKDQIAAFQDMPEALLFYATVQASNKQRGADSATIMAAQAALTNLVAGINTKAITTRAQIDSAFSKIKT